MNGSTKTLTFVGSIIGGVIAIIMVIYTIVYAPLNSAIAQESKEAMERDLKAKEDLAIVTKEQQIVNQEILITLAQIKTDIGYIRGRTK